MKRTLLTLIALLFIFTSCNEAVKTKTVTEVKKPNIILIMSDDQGWGDLSISGNSNLNTPHIDALAKNGVTFENFFVQPVCSPTRAELLTGRYATRSGVYGTSAGGERMSLNETTIAQILKEAGYQTAAYGKWHNGMQPPYHPNSRGFDDYYGFTSGHWGNYFSPMLEHNGKIVKGEGFLVDDLTNHGIDFIEKNKEKPFFLYLPYNTPHSPMQVPDAYWNNFKDKNLNMKYHGTEEENENFSRAALAMVENIDYNVGRVTSKLKELELEENTIVIYLSDNGPNGYRWNGGMRGKKGSTDEGGVRSPFFIQWKDVIPAGKKINQIAAAIDLLPTLVNLTNTAFETKKPLDGRNLSTLIFNDNQKWDDRIIVNNWRGKTSLRTQNYRLDADNKLYDMVNDHGQTTDVAAQNQQITDSLINAKNNWLSETIQLTKETDDRAITLGHPDYKYTQVPARDGIPHGNIKRSNIHPNNTFFTNWQSAKDSITWDVEVLADGNFEVELYYTMKPENAGIAIELSHAHNKLVSQITEAHDPPLTGMENDRDPRIESYVKDFKPKILGTINLKKGRSLLTLKSPLLKEKDGIDVRLLMFKRIE
ncbi:arylsulfatase [Aurantibacter crassamenti]|uniref:arylsulfatase n=1 Tax=Aurantibacter crassamenti TaxID=1837375 RepID=UPI001939F105|nr:arylsulfatase [Aurantibacter crassamenti]MBM1107717.1 arylsulfatase [Aurantibacter crassamenti]